MPWISKTINNKVYYYYDSQNGKPVLIDLHGFGVTADNHLNKASKPLEDHYRLIIPEYPGHGELIDIELNNINELAKYIKTLILNFDEMMDLIGRSVGGNLALQLANDKLACKKINRIIVIEAPIVSYKDSFNFVFRAMTNMLIKLPENISGKLNYLQRKFFGVEQNDATMFFEKCKYRMVLSNLRNIDCENTTLQNSNAFYIYAPRDVYLTKNNIKTLEKLKKKVFINTYAGHFCDQTNPTMVSLIYRILSSV